MRARPEKASFGYRTVGAGEKKRLVHDQFTPSVFGIVVIYSGRKPQEVPHAAN